MSTVPRRQDSCDSSDSHDSLESYESLDSYRSDDLMEAPTLSSKELKRARELALKVLASESPEEAKRIFTEGCGVKIANQLREKVETGATKPPPPPKADGGKPGATVQPPPTN